MKKIINFIIITPILLLIVSCADTGVSQDTKNFVAEVKRKEPRPIEDLPPEKEYEPYIYTADLERNPFLSLSDLVGEAEFFEEEAIVEVKQSARPDKDRPRELLERYNLETFRMAGVIRDDDEMWALVVDERGVLHRVRRGNYMGENSGIILEVTEDAIYLEELVVDGQGGWMSRSASINLQ